MIDHARITQSNPTDPFMKATFQASVDSVVIGKRLCQLQSGEEISYDALCSLVPGRDLRGKHRYILETGRALAMKESNVVTGCVSGKGVKRLTNAEIVSLPDSTFASIRRSAKKASRKVLCSDYEKLTVEDKQKFNSSMSVLGAIVQFTSVKALNAVEDRVQKAMARLPIEETMGLFLKAGK